MLDCPPHTATSPKRMSASAKASPVVHENVMLVAAEEAGCGGRAWRHTPAASATEARPLKPASVVLTPVPGAAKPHTMAEAGAR